ncbi:MAG: CoB--CoM heterodisulfide reductase iron-sulfur subunit B family protein [Candidatus Adiutricales bacterium]
MKFAIFWGCKIPYYVEHYATSTRAVLEKLGVQIEEIEFNCCGYPTRNLHFESFILSAARNLALAEREGLDILTPCKCCFGSFKHAQHALNENRELLRDANKVLKEEGLRLNSGVEVKHLLTVLAEDVGIDFIKENVQQPFEKLKLAAHYGCHALRPAKITGFDDPYAPTIFENLIKAIGGESVEWSRRLECCGNPVWGKNKELSLDLLKKKSADAKKAGADFLCTACTYCQIQFDTVQSEALADNESSDGLPAILYPQLLGLSLGLSSDALGIDKNNLDISRVESFLAQPEPPEEEEGPSPEEEEDETETKDQPSEVEKTEE